MTQVRAVYEFEAQPNSGELSISVDEILTVLREGIEGGWLEGRNSKGQLGLFPESYVVKIDPIPPPPRPITVYDDGVACLLRGSFCQRSVLVYEDFLSTWIVIATNILVQVPPVLFTAQDLTFHCYQNSFNIWPVANPEMASWQSEFNVRIETDLAIHTSNSRFAFKSHLEQPLVASHRLFEPLGSSGFENA
ncbi:Sorting nexin-9 [Toxocara canis]|uniref:Sorting nexin-9 n=1 Tax=Toxocara canis TaxID=6265 RepID=A0A0B2UZ53_TOXCA|nr:Sorting nexin-9 [Toxocara canis]